jgi:protein-S-isoprenylcysteine O-methyltransferase Ste14
VPIPEAHLGVLGAGLLLSRVRPWRVPRHRGVVPLGWTMLASGVAVIVWATRSAATVDLEQPDRVVRRGAYRWSRHPMYVGWAMVQLGVALLRTSAWHLALLPVLAVLVHRETGREEYRLAQTFAEEYQGYRSQVRRYLGHHRVRGGSSPSSGQSSPSSPR